MKKIVLGALALIGIIFVLSISQGMKDSAKYQWENFEDKNIKTNIEKAFKEINFDTSKIETIKKIEDWNNGPRYKMLYKDEFYIIYAYEDGQISSIKEENEERKEIYSNNNVKFEDENKEDNENKASVITYGELGDYGRTVIYSGKEYIKYFLPEGEYEVKALVKNSMFFIEDTKIYKNSSGYDESDIIDTINLSNKGDKKTIVINSENCINLVMNSVISVKKIN